MDEFAMLPLALPKPGWDKYFSDIAWVVAARSNCLRRQIGAVLVKDHRIISTGYNGTPVGTQDCNAGGCPRCQDAQYGKIVSHAAYDSCLCVHAEVNTILLAARHGSATEGSTLYTTLRPCLGCVKEAIQAGIQRIIFDRTFRYEDALEQVYLRLISQPQIEVYRNTDWLDDE